MAVLSNDELGARLAGRRVGPVLHQLSQPAMIETETPFGNDQLMVCSLCEPLERPCPGRTQKGSEELCGTVFGGAQWYRFPFHAQTLVDATLNKQMRCVTDKWGTQEQLSRRFSVPPSLTTSESPPPSQLFTASLSDHVQNHDEPSIIANTLRAPYTHRGLSTLWATTGGICLLVAYLSRL